MNFIEQLFGISPDAGSGLMEACLIAVPLGVLVLRALLKRDPNSDNYNIKNAFSDGRRIGVPIRS